MTSRAGLLRGGYNGSGAGMAYDFSGKTALVTGAGKGEARCCSY